MKRVLVIGSGGAGKSSFSRRLGKATGIDVIHLDRLYWRPGWRPTPREEWERTVSDLVLSDSWIMDGNFGGTRQIRIRAADTVILLDTNRWVCLYRVIKRAIKYRGRSRPDMAEGCDEKVDLEFLLWIWNYPQSARRRVFEEMRAFPEKRFVVIRSHREAEDLLEAAARSAGSSNGINA